MTDLAADPNERISILAEELRASGKLGRSDLFNRLFDFLLEQSLTGRSPKEFEVAQKVFGKETGFDDMQDASVRVHIHRLRRRLEEVYAGSSADRLVIPRGEYRLIIQQPEELLPEEPAPVLTPKESPTHIESRFGWLLSYPWRIMAAIGLAFALGIGLGFAALLPHLASEKIAVAETTFWKPLATSKRLTFLVTGDYYIFGESNNTAEVSRLVREFSINSREDLDDYLMAHPDDYGRYKNLDLHYLPVSTSYAMRDVLPIVNGLAKQASIGRPWVITMSRLTPEAMKGSNIIYVGFLSSLGLLRDPLFEASGFSIGASYDELIDRASGKHYVANWSEVTDNRTPWRDFAYLASFPGPMGNRILVIAGTRDAAVTQAAEIAADKAQLDQIASRAGNTEGFEALYEVRTLGTLNLGSKLLVARPLKLDRLWRPDSTPGKFPDQAPDTAPAAK